MLFASLCALAQDIDNVVSPAGRKPFTFLDQIEDPQERAEYLRLYRERGPAARRRLAEAFLERRPQSWLLAQVYEIAAKASIDLDDFPAALRFGKESLLLLPENPLLLVPLANVQVQQNALRDAASSAADALEYLYRFGRPSAIPESDWPEIERELRASSYFVMGRVAATEGLSARGPGRKAKLEAAAAHLSRARRLHDADPESAYLMALVQLALGNTRDAAAQFLAASRTPGPLQAKALSQLRALDHTGIAASEPAPAPAEAVRPPRRQSAYAGSQACRSCHSRQHAAWEHTGMARMFRPYRRENIIGDFSGRTYSDESGASLARMGASSDGHYFETRGADGLWRSFRVDYTIGSKWQQGYATRDARGQIHVLPIQYNRLEKTWLNYWKLIDPPGSLRTNLDSFHLLAEGTNYQLNCAPCHTSQLGASKNDHQQPQDLVFREAGINCEMCHGPSAGHSAAMAAGKKEERQPSDPPVDFKRLAPREYVRICAQCHMQSAMREPGKAGEYNYSSTGESFAPTYPSRPFVEFSRRAFYKDGRFRETTFIVEALMRSACYRLGQASCGSCHDPHPLDAAANPASLKFRGRPDQMCLQCHPRFAANVEAHTRHAAASEASRCVSCHMPRIMNSVMFLARTHQIDDRPRPDLTLRFGPRESPNSCQLCHLEKDAQWVAAQLRSR